MFLWQQCVHKLSYLDEDLLTLNSKRSTIDFECQRKDELYNKGKMVSRCANNGNESTKQSQSVSTMLYQVKQNGHHPILTVKYR